MEGTYYYYHQDASGYEFWVWPKYDGADYDEPKLRAILNAFSPRSSAISTYEAWRYLGIRTGDGEADFDEHEILYLSRHFTLLMRTPAGHVTESHQDFVIAG